MILLNLAIDFYGGFTSTWLFSRIGLTSHCFAGEINRFKSCTLKYYVIKVGLNRQSKAREILFNVFGGAMKRTLTLLTRINRFVMTPHSSYQIFNLWFVWWKQNSNINNKRIFVSSMSVIWSKFTFIKLRSFLARFSHKLSSSRVHRNACYWSDNVNYAVSRLIQLHVESPTHAHLCHLFYWISVLLSHWGC